MTGHWAWVLLVVLFAGGVAVGGLCVSWAGSRREDRAYDEGRADERADMEDPPGPDGPPVTPRSAWVHGGGTGEGAAMSGNAGPGVDHMPGRPGLYPGPDGKIGTRELRAESEWEPEPGDRVYQWAHPHPIRATAPLTVIDWDALPWAEKEQLGLWDFGRRLEAEGWQIVAGDREPDEPDWSETIELPEWAA